MFVIIRPEAWFFLLLMSAVLMGIFLKKIPGLGGSIAFFLTVILLGALSVWIGFHIMQSSFGPMGVSLIGYIVAPIEFSIVYIFGRLFVCLLVYVIQCLPLGIFYYIYYFREKKTQK